METDSPNLARHTSDSWTLLVASGDKQKLRTAIVAVDQTKVAIFNAVSGTFEDSFA